MKCFDWLKIGSNPSSYDTQNCDLKLQLLVENCALAQTGHGLMVVGLNPLRFLDGYSVIDTLEV